MANAIRVRQAPSVTIVSAGPFGRRVSEILATGLTGCRRLSSGEIDAAFSAGPSVVVLALWRPEPGLCERADELSFETGTGWLPVVAEHPLIRIGPMVFPPAGPCFACYARRRAQHDNQHWGTAALSSAYESDRNCGPQGYLPHQARMAAAVASHMLGRPAEAQVTGEVATIRLAQGDLRASRVIACHGCPRCGAGPGLGTLAPRADVRTAVSDGNDMVAVS